MHVLNNWLAFGVALAFGDMSSALNPSGGTWWSIPVTLTQSLTYLALAWWVARQMGLTNRTDPAVLAAPESARVRFRPALRGHGPGRRKPAAIGIWCNWQHDWFWSS